MPTDNGVNNLVFVLFILCIILLLFHYTKSEYFSSKRGLHMEGYINKPVLDGKTPYKNDGLREIESSNEYFGMSCTSNKENCVSNKWKTDSSIQMNANQRKIEGMGDGDENQWSMDHNNIGLTIDSTLNEMQSQDLNAKLKCNDVCPSLSGMNRKWTDTALDEIGMGLGGFEMYGATDAKINN